ncbi:MAG: 2-amino-4-hydroxy-6-hydroxymethyldihydropteridine diphosphokinase [Anaerolineae bacterium]
MGANLPSDVAGPPVATCAAALDRLERGGVAVVKRSRWFRSQAYPPSDQPDFVNGVAQVSTALSPGALLTRLHEVERQFGRRRAVANAARPIDLDLLDYEGLVQQGGDGRSRGGLRFQHFAAGRCAGSYGRWRLAERATFSGLPIICHRKTKLAGRPFTKSPFKLHFYLLLPPAPRPDRFEPQSSPGFGRRPLSRRFPVSPAPPTGWPASLPP